MAELCPNVHDCVIEVNGIATHYVTAGDGEPVVLLHGDGENLFDWCWILPELARTHRVYALDFPGAGDSGKPAAAYSAALLGRFLAAFLDALHVDRVAMVGNSGGGLVALFLALAQPNRVASLTLLDSAGLGAAVNPGMVALSLPRAGELGIAWSRTPPGAVQRARLRAGLQFAHPLRVPKSWLQEQERLAQLPGFLEATLSFLRSQLSPWGQRVVVLNQLPRLRLPVLVVWGTRDLVLPVYQARLAVDLLPQGALAQIEDCGHLPHVERPADVLRVLRPFLAEHPL